MHDRETASELDPSDLEQTTQPATFVLETVYKGKRRYVADGVAFPPPDEQVVIRWRGSGSTELIDSVDKLYEKFGQSPRVMWWHNSEILTEAEPQTLIDAY